MPATCAARLQPTVYCGLFQEKPVMSSKETAATNQLLTLLESRYAIRVIWALRDGHAQTFRLLQDSVGSITPNTLNTRLRDLRAAGFITPSGQDLFKRLSDLQAFAVRWVASQSKKK